KPIRAAGFEPATAPRSQSEPSAPSTGCSLDAPRRRLDAPEVAWREQWTAWTMRDAAGPVCCCMAPHVPCEVHEPWLFQPPHSEWVEDITKKIAAVRSLCAGEEEATPDAPPGYMDGWNDLARA